MELRALPWHETFLEVELAKAKLLVNASGIGVEEGASPLPPEMLGDRPVRPRPGPEPRQHAAHARGPGPRRDGRERSRLVPCRLRPITFRLLTGQAAPADVMRAALAIELGLPEEGIAVVGD